MWRGETLRVHVCKYLLTLTREILCRGIPLVCASLLDSDVGYVSSNLQTCALCHAEALYFLAYQDPSPKIPVKFLCKRGKQGGCTQGLTGLILPEIPRMCRTGLLKALEPLPRVAGECRRLQAALFSHHNYTDVSVYHCLLSQPQI